MDSLFTPDGFAEVIRYRGRYIRVRTADGIHLNVSGTAIAAKVIAAAIASCSKPRASVRPRSAALPHAVRDGLRRARLAARRCR